MKRPGRRDWAEAAVLLVLVGALALGIEGATDMFGPRDLSLHGDRLTLVLIALIVPSLAEELVFRGPLVLPRFRTLPVAAILLVAFVAWHPVQAYLLFPGEAELFSSLAFLAVAAALGLAASVSAWRSGGLILPVLMHWTLVAGWIIGWGGPKGEV